MPEYVLRICERAAQPFSRSFELLESLLSVLRFQVSLEGDGNEIVT
jgi:hypothetical protein